MKLDTLAILGVGLVGGSVALAARQRGAARVIVGVEPDETRRERLLSLGLVDETAASADSERVGQADLVVCCVPVNHIAELVLHTAARAKPGQLLTDTGSTKAAIVHAVEESLPGHVHFVGGHPLAGSEKSGPDHASARLFADRVVVLTPTERSSPDAVARVSAFWQALGAQVRMMSPDEHDRAVAWTSHLPHLVSSALAGVLPETLTDLTASGFRDTTRLAAGDPGLWTAIFEQNREFLLQALGHFDDRIEQFRRALEMGDAEALITLLAGGRQRRQSLHGQGESHS
jgi:prephenate dehydrogenase